MAENDWNITKPIDHTKIGELPQKIRDVKSSAKLIIDKEHVTPSTDNAGGQHLKGAARVYLSDAVATLDPEGNSLDTTATTDDGRIHVNTSASNEMRVFIATAAGVFTSWEHVRVGRVKAATEIDANSRGVVNVASGTVTGQAIHVGQIDTTYIKIHEPATGAAIRVHIDTTYIATAQASGLTVRLLSISSAVVSSAGAITCTPRTMAGADDSIGTITLPNGLIMKWGKKTISGGFTAVTFAAAFPNSCFQVIVCGGTSTSDPDEMAAHTISVNGFTIQHSTQTNLARWFAIGR